MSISGFGLFSVAFGGARISSLPYDCSTSFVSCTPCALQGCVWPVGFLHDYLPVQAVSHNNLWAKHVGFRARVAVPGVRACMQIPITVAKSGSCADIGFGTALVVSAWVLHSYMDSMLDHPPLIHSKPATSSWYVDTLECRLHVLDFGEGLFAYSGDGLHTG